MSVGFYLLGKLPRPRLDPDGFLSSIEKWINRKCAAMEPICRRGYLEEKPALFCQLHPAGEEVEICLADPNHVTVSANTSTVGPGYHIYLCETLHRWEDAFDVSWVQFGPDDDTTFGDEANFFYTSRQENVFKEMSRWLRGLTGCFFDGTMEPDSKEIALCMPMNERFLIDRMAITQMGPRDTEWLKGMSKGELSEGEFFPWFEPELTAQFFLKRALVRMWSDVRWRQPISESERRLLQHICKDLETAYKLDNSLPLPWNEWNEILGLLGKHGRRFRFVEERAHSRGEIGYRRTHVKTQLPGNWWITTEGSFSEFRSDKEGNLCSFDPPREIWLTSYTFSAEDPVGAFEKMRADLLDEAPELVIESENYVSTASIHSQEADGETYFRLSSSSATILNRSVCTLIFVDPTDRGWAIKTWRSLEAPKPRQSS